LIGLNGKSKSFQPFIDLENTSFYELYESYETPDGIIKPYEENSGRSDYNIAIKDNFSASRIAKYGNGKPDKAIDIFQSNTNQYVTTASNINEINQLNEQDVIYGLEGLTSYLTYKLDSVAYGDIKYFIEASFNSVEYASLIDEIYDLPYGDCQANNVTGCCYSSSAFRNEMYALIQSFYNSQNDIFKGIYELHNDQESCSNFPFYKLNNYPTGFLRTNAQNYTLENGNYPIFFRYVNPLNDSEYDGSIINVSRTSGSD
jgi:hypothetical protein